MIQTPPQNVTLSALSPPIASEPRPIWKRLAISTKHYGNSADLSSQHSKQRTFQHFAKSWNTPFNTRFSINRTITIPSAKHAYSQIEHALLRPTRTFFKMEYLQIRGRIRRIEKCKSRKKVCVYPELYDSQAFWFGLRSAILLVAPSNSLGPASVLLSPCHAGEVLRWRGSKKQLHGATLKGPFSAVKKIVNNSTISVCWCTPNSEIHPFIVKSG